MGNRVYLQKVLKVQQHYKGKNVQYKHVATTTWSGVMQFCKKETTVSQLYLKMGELPRSFQHKEGEEKEVL